ncbi:Imm50 family immunity protein [Nocardia sp. BMG111209]|uniref:Imm50 family immunity protein n=1 Tax=Nocardia sp. BMG111209 TaxID=1160137 RepID=UPI0018C9C141|nr:Imm50 family immunity protein [Nocardia sp. BMG111209]
MSWIELLTDARAVQAIYRDNPPSLENLILHELCLHRDGPRVVIKADLADFPDNPPKKWRDRGFDTVRVELLLDGVTRAEISGISINSQISLRLTREKGQIHATVGPGSTTTLDIWSDLLTLNLISAYHTSPTEDRRIVLVEALAEAVETPWAFIVRCVAGTVEPGTEFHYVQDPNGNRIPSILRVVRILRSGTEADLLEPPHSALMILTGKTKKPPEIGDKLVG